MTYNRKTYPNRKTLPIFVKIKGTSEILHPRELIENVYEKYQLSEKTIQVYAQDERNSPVDGAELWSRQA